MAKGNDVPELWKDLISMDHSLISPSICLTGLTLIKSSHIILVHKIMFFFHSNTSKVEGT